MANFNKGFLLGNLTADPEMRYTPAGTAIVELRLAVNHFRKDQNGERTQAVDFFNVDVWGRMGENCAEYLRKGRPVFIEYRAKQESWTDRETQKKRTRIKFVANDVQFLNGGNREENETQTQAPGGYPDMNNEFDAGEEIPF